MANQSIKGRFFTGLAEPTTNADRLSQMRRGASGNRDAILKARGLPPTGSAGDITRNRLEEIRRNRASSISQAGTGKATAANPVVNIPTAPDVTASASGTGGVNENLASLMRDFGQSEGARIFLERGGSQSDVNAALNVGTPTTPATTGSYTGVDTGDSTTNAYGDVGGIADIYDYLGQTGQRNIDEAQRMRDAEAQRQQGIYETEAQRISKSVQDLYAPQYSQLEREGARMIETARRGSAFRGTGMSGRALENEQVINEQIAEESRAIAAAQSAEQARQLAIAQGAKGKALEPYDKAVSDAKAIVAGLGEKRLLAEKEYLGEQVKAGAEAEANRIKNRIAALEAQGLTEDPDTGERVATLKAQAQQIDSAIALSKLDISQRELAIKETLAPLQAEKLRADIAKANRAGSSSPSTTVAAIEGLGFNPNMISTYDMINEIVEREGVTSAEAATKIFSKKSDALLVGQQADNYTLFLDEQAQEEAILQQIEDAARAERESTLLRPGAPITPLRTGDVTQTGEPTQF